jgi:hypothetical protein
MRGHRQIYADVLIGRTLALAVLAGFVGAVYAVVVVGIGAALGRGQLDLVLSIVATVIVAVAFERVRDVGRRVANHLIDGGRAAPYEVLSRFSRQTADVYAAEEVLPRLARILADGTGATSAWVWLRAGETLRLAASWPDPPGTAVEIPLTGSRPLQVPGATRWPASTIMASCWVHSRSPNRPGKSSLRSRAGS